MSAPWQNNARGFSLIEILIAILVLAIGLLGLGAVFPAVIAEQREAVETTRGVSAASTAGATLRGSSEIVGGFDGRVATSPRPALRPWEFLAADKEFSREQDSIGGTSGGAFKPTSLWEVGLNWRGQNYFDLYRQYGVITFNGIDEDSGQPIKVESTGLRADAIIPVESRLFPPAFSGQDPQYVWDAAFRLDPGSRRIEAAIFVRRIDTRIRVSEQTTLSRLLTDGTLSVGGGVVTGGTGPSAFPVAVDGNWIQTAGDSNGAVYAVPMWATLDRDTSFDEPNDAGLYDRILLLRPANAPGGYPNVNRIREIAGRVGQKLVDNLGTVRTVVDIDDESGQTWLVIDPAYTEAERRGGVDPAFGNSVDPARAQQVVFTPQVPVAVQIVRVQE